MPIKAIHAFFAGPPKEKDRPLPIRFSLISAALGIAMLLLAKLLSRFPWIVERCYTEYPGQWLGRLLAFLTHYYPYSAAELLLILGGAGGFFWALYALYNLFRGKRRLLNIFLCGVLRLIGVIGILLTSFYLFWGFNYSRADAVTRLSWEKWDKTPPGEEAVRELEERCRELVEITNQSYEASMKTTDIGHASEAPLSVKAMDQAIDDAYCQVAKRLGLHPSFALSRGPAKPVLGSFVMSRLLISGIYCPYTGEANYNREIPECTRPEVIAHEKAHQRGITSEDEANFFGFLACIAGEEPYLQYSAFLMAQRQLLTELTQYDPEKVAALVARRHPGVQRDVDAMKAFYSVHAGAVSRAQSRMNDLYLKANGVKGGVKAYQACSRLILAYSRYNDGSCRFK